MINRILQYVAANVPVLVWGPPGVGKTAAITAEADRRGIHLEVVIGSTIDPTDLGRPVVDERGDVRLAPPPWTRRLVDALSAGREAWLFLDELTCAPPSVQAALLRVTQERKVADLDLAGVRLIAAANPPDLGVDVSEITAPTANRWAHLEWEVDHEAWCAGELGGWGDPDPILAAIRASVTGWIHYSPSSLVAPPTAGAETIRAWPSPRSWSNACKVAGRLEGGLSSKEGRRAVASLVGSAAATEMTAWLADTEIPDPVSLLDGKADLPARGDRAMLAMNSATGYAVAHGRLPDFWKLCCKQRTDLGLLSARRGLRAAEASGAQVEMVDDLQFLADRLREINT